MKQIYTYIFLFSLFAIVLFAPLRYVHADQTGVLVPIADGSSDSADWITDGGAGVACSGTDCSLMVNEVSGSVCNGISDGATSFIRSAVLNAIQTFRIDISSIPDGATVHGVTIGVCDERGATNATFQTRLCVDGSCSDSGKDIVALPAWGEDQQLHAIDFVKTSGTALEIGITNKNNRRIEVSKIEAVLTYSLPVAPSASSGGGGVALIHIEPPQIFNFHIQKTATSALISFNTNELSASTVWYGTEPISFNHQEKGSDSATSHTISISNLNPLENYYFQIFARDTHGSSTSTSVIDTAAPLATEAHIESIASTSAVISWTTNELTHAVVHYGTVFAPDNFSAEDVSPTLLHRITIQNLIPDTMYYFRTESHDLSGNTSMDFRQGFRTLVGDTKNVPLPKPIFTKNVTKTLGRISMEWQNPSDPRFAFIIIRRQKNTPPTFGEGDIVYQGTGESFNDTVYGVEPTFYSVFSIGEDGSFSEPVVIPFRDEEDTIFMNGVENSEVVVLQKRLQGLGFLSKTIRASGFFGSLTETAVKSFQRSYGFSPNGIFTHEQFDFIIKGVPISLYAPIYDTWHGGEGSEEIWQAQELLQAIGFFPYDGRPTGFFGTITEKAVLAFQKSRKIPQTGIMDASTLNEINTFVSH